MIRGSSFSRGIFIFGHTLWGLSVIDRNLKESTDKTARTRFGIKSAVRYPFSLIHGGSPKLIKVNQDVYNHCIILSILIQI